MTLTDRLRESYADGVPFKVQEENRTLAQVLLDVSERYPNRVATDFLGAQLTYAQLVNQVRLGAAALHRAGVKPGDRVSITLPNCTQHVVALYSIFMLGAIAVETNPLAPKSELTAELDRAGCKVIICWENSLSSIDVAKLRPRAVFTVDLTKALPFMSRLLINLPVAPARARKSQMSTPPPGWARDWDKALARVAPWPNNPVGSAEDIAVLLHTGGTTGVPKAVKLTHHSVGTNAAQSQAWVPNLHEGAEVLFAVLPFFHAFGLSVNLCAGIRIGATNVLFPKFDVDIVLDAQKRLPCTFFPGVAPMFDRLAKGVEGKDVDLKSIKYAVSGAMPLDPQIARRWEDATGGYLIEGYGMTEASPIILGSPLSADRRPSTLGIPFPSTEVRIVDPENPDRDVADGEVGELLARGPQVFAGYWDNPQETAEAFHDGWLRTGDLAQVVDGFVKMADRRKELIISGGFNVYPSQVEDAVRTMPGIEDVAVVGLEGSTRGEDVVAALILEPGATVSLDDVRRWAEKSIAHYALPRQIVLLSELPRSQIGKVMRRRVKEYLVEAGDSMKESTLDLRERIARSSDEVREKLSAGSEVALNQLRDFAGQLSDQVEDAADAVLDSIRDYRPQSPSDRNASREHGSGADGGPAGSERSDATGGDQSNTADGDHSNAAGGN